MRKAITALMLTTALITGAALTADAATSISTFIPEAPTVSADSETQLEEGESLIVQNADTAAYENETVAQVVEQFNDDSTVTTVKEVLDSLNVDTSKNTKTSSGKIVNATLYEAITPIFDLAVQESDGTVHYNSNGSVTATITVEAAKDRDASELLLIQIDPTTGAVSFVTVDALDSETGEITATFETLGPVMLVEKVPIVVKNTTPELYGDEDTKTNIEELRDTLKESYDKGEGDNRTMNWRDVLYTLMKNDGTDRYHGNFYQYGNQRVQSNTATKTRSSAETEAETDAVTDTADEDAETETETETEWTKILDEEIEVEEDVIINIDDYSSCMAFADMAIKQGEDSYSYDMSGSLLAEAYRDLEEVDWERIVLYADPDYDVEAAADDLSLLTEIEPFVLENSFVMQINSETGDINYIWEPTIHFEILVEEEEETETEAETTAETETETEEMSEALTEAESETETEDDELLYWTVHDEDKTSENEVPVLVIEGEFEALGPFALFMPADSELSE